LGRAARLTLAGAALACLASGPAAAEPAWRLEPAASRLGFSATQAGAVFEGRFTRFQAEIRFDEADLASSRFEVTVDTASADTGEARRDEILTGPDFFWAEQYPTAVFEATEFTRAGNAYLARGTLILRGVSKPVPVRFRFERSAEGGAGLVGSTRLRRLDFGVGQGEWTATEWVGDEVEVSFELRLSR